MEIKQEDFKEYLSKNFSKEELEVGHILTSKIPMVLSSYTSEQIIAQILKECRIEDVFYNYLNYFRSKSPEVFHMYFGLQDDSTIYRTLSKYSSTKDNADDSFLIALITYFKKLKDTEGDSYVIKLGTTLTDLLWQSQKYDARKLIGEYIEESASILDEKAVLAKVLIDDLGWTNVELGQDIIAKNKISQGIDIANELRLVSLEAKGYRHLFGLNYRKDELDIAEDYLNKSNSIIQSMDDGSPKDRAMAGFNFANASLLVKKKDFKKAIDRIEDASKLYKANSTNDWSLKTLSRKGDIYLAMGDLKQARDCFYRGFAESGKSYFRKGLVRNLIGMGSCYQEDKDIKKAREKFKEARDLAQNIGMIYELKIINQKFIDLNNSK